MRRIVLALPFACSRRARRHAADAICASGWATTATCSIRRCRASTPRASSSPRSATSCSTSTRSQHRAAARARLGDLGRRQDGHDEAPARREVPRRRAVRRSGGQVQPRPPSHHEGLVPPLRAQRRRLRRGGRSADHQAQPQGALLAASGPAHRPRRHDDGAEGDRGGGRQVRAPSGLRRPLQVRRAYPPGPHRGREVRRLLEQGPGLHRQDHLPADRRCDDPPGQSQVGLARPDRARAGDRHQGRALQPEAPAQQGDVARLGRPADQHEQRAEVGQSAGQGPAGAPGLRPRDRSPGHQPGGLQRRVRAGQPVGQPGQPVLSKGLSRSRSAISPRPRR